jgi:hypothetical protein
MSLLIQEKDLNHHQQSKQAHSIKLNTLSDFDIDDMSVFVPIKIRVAALQALINDRNLPLSDVHSVDIQSHQLLKALLLNSVAYWD